jgi:hypothetical protein
MCNTTYKDDNLNHDLFTGRAMSGIIHVVNQTPVIQFCKEQKTVETANYGKNFVVACQAAQQIINPCSTVCMIGIPLNGPTWMFGNKSSVILSSTIPHSTFSERHNALLYHYVHKCIANNLFTSSMFMQIKSF